MDWQELTFEADSPAPIYRQIQERIAGWIRNGRLTDGSRLLPTRELAGLLGLNRTTVAAAYEALEQEGLLKAHVGRGSFVCAPAASPFRWQERFRSAAPDRALPWTAAAPENGVISFAGARPDPASFPVPAVRRAAERELRVHGGAILQLGAAEGYGPLRELLARNMLRQNIARDGDEVLIISGCQQGLDLLARVLVGPGDTVLLEDPLYPGARDLFLAAGAQVRGIPVGPEGLSVTDLEQQLSRVRARLLVVTPNFQNPTGATLPLAARREILRLAARFQLPVIENDVSAGLRYHGVELPSLKSLDSDGRVVYLSSFSKAAFPGLRVGWCVAAPPLVRRLAAAKQLADLHTDQLSQAVLCRMATEGSLEAYRRQVVRRGSARLAAALEVCRARMPEGVEFFEPQGGLHLWLRLPESMDAAELLARARAEKVLFIPGRYFSVERPHHAALRLSFAGLEPDRIRRGLATLARLIRAQRGEAAGSSSILV